MRFMHILRKVGATFLTVTNLNGIENILRIVGVPKITYIQHGYCTILSCLNRNRYNKCKEKQAPISYFRSNFYETTSTSIRIKPKHNWLRLWDQSNMGCLSLAFLNKVQ